MGTFQVTLNITVERFVLKDVHDFIVCRWRARCAELPEWEDYYGAGSSEMTELEAERCARRDALRVAGTWEEERKGHAKHLLRSSEHGH